jgi:hypothetical protein
MRRGTVEHRTNLQYLAQVAELSPDDYRADRLRLKGAERMLHHRGEECDANEVLGGIEVLADSFSAFSHDSDAHVRLPGCGCKD